MTENPLRCPKCHLCNLMKLPWGEWKCPSCGYIGSPVAEDFTAKAEMSQPEKSFKNLTSKAAHGDLKSMKSIVDLLDGCNVNQRYKIEEFLLHYKRYSIDIIIDSLKSRSNSKKSALIGVLAYFGDEKAVEPLISLLDKSSIEIKGQVIQALGIIKDKQAVLPLIQQLKNPNLGIKKFTIKALLQIDDKRAIVPIKRTIITIIDELENSSDEFCDDFFLFFQENPSVINLVCHDNNDVVLKLWGVSLQLLKSENPSVVSNANALLLKIIPFSSTNFNKIIDSIPKTSKQEFIKILGRSDDENAVNCLLTQLKTSEYNIQNALIQALINNKMTIPKIIKEYNAENFEPLELLINCLLESQDKEILKNLNELLLKLREISSLLLINRIDSSTAMQTENIIALLSGMKLETLPAKKIFEQLSVCSDDVNVLVIPFFGKRSNHTAVNPLINLLTTTDNQTVRSVCSETLIKIRDMSSIPLLMELLHDDDENVRKTAGTTIEALRLPEINDELLEKLTIEYSRKKEEENKKLIEEINRIKAENRKIELANRKLKEEGKNQKIRKISTKRIILDYSHSEKKMKMKIQGILAASKGPDHSRRLEAISSLRDINSIDAITALKKISNYSDLNARNLAIKILREKARK